MKTIAITTKAKANRVQVDSLFSQGGTLSRMKYCTGKFKPGSMPVGREFQVNDDVFALWAESRKDNDGPYISLFCMAKE